MHSPSKFVSAAPLTFQICWPHPLYMSFLVVLQVVLQIYKPHGSAANLLLRIYFKGYNKMVSSVFFVTLDEGLLMAHVRGFCGCLEGGE